MMTSFLCPAYQCPICPSYKGVCDAPKIAWKSFTDNDVSRFFPARPHSKTGWFRKTMAPLYINSRWPVHFSSYPNNESRGMFTFIFNSFFAWQKWRLTDCLFLLRISHKSIISWLKKISRCQLLMLRSIKLTFYFIEDQARNLTVVCNFHQHFKKCFGNVFHCQSAHIITMRHSTPSA